MESVNHQTAEFLRRVRKMMRPTALQDAWSAVVVSPYADLACVNAAYDVLERNTGLTIGQLTKKHTHAEVLALLDKAIEELREKK